MARDLGHPDPRAPARDVSRPFLHAESRLPSCTRARRTPRPTRLGGPALSICRDLKEQGGTDYYAQALPFSTGEISYVSWASNAAAVSPMKRSAALDVMVPSLAQRVELESAYHGRAPFSACTSGEARRIAFSTARFRRGGGSLTPFGDLFLRSARLHRDVRSDGARRRREDARRLFRSRCRCSDGTRWRRAEVRRRRRPRHFSDDRRRSSSGLRERASSGGSRSRGARPAQRQRLPEKPWRSASRSTSAK